MDALVAPYHWDDREKLHQDYLIVTDLYEELLTELSEKLNSVHGVNRTVRYWRIVVGPWLGYFLQMLFDRWFMLREVIQKNAINQVRCIQRTTNSWIPRDMEEFETIMVNDNWNEAIYAQLLKFFKISVELVQKEKKLSDALTNFHSTAKARGLKNILKRGTNFVSSALCRNNEYFLISTYLPIWQEILLQLKLGQVPKKWFSPPISFTSIDPTAREWRVNKIKDENNFSEIARSMIPRHIPTSYLEGYKKIVSFTKKLGWPCHPKAIFTSNAHFSNDVFKIWAADQVTTATSLVIGQHGGFYGAGLWGFAEDHQISISDRFLSWGWGDSKHKKVTPVGNLKSFYKRGVWNKLGFALLVGMSMPRNSYHMYSVPVAAGQWQKYFDDQLRFVRALPQNLRDQLLVRLYSQDYGHDQKRRWKDSFPKIRVDDGITSMSALIKRSRLYISTYNATTYLESMSLNIPTLIFWNPQLWELRDSAIPYFEKLKSVGIFHETPESAAQQMTSIWDDVSEWWQRSAVQSARLEFCDHYARLPTKPISICGRILHAASAESALCGAKHKRGLAFSSASMDAK